MTIPLPVIMAAVSLMQREADARSRRQEAEASNTVRLAEMELERERLQSELAAADRQAEREKEVVLRMVQAAETVHQMKVEAIVSLFRDAKSLLETHQRILAEEKSAMHRQLVETEVSAQRHVMIMKRQAELDRELSAIDDQMTELAENCVEVIANLQPQLGMGQIEEVVRRGFLIQAG